MVKFNPIFQLEYREEDSKRRVGFSEKLSYSRCTKRADDKYGA
jgi:hypothetical protein